MIRSESRRSRTSWLQVSCGPWWWWSSNEKRRFLKDTKMNWLGGIFGRNSWFLFWFIIDDFDDYQSRSWSSFFDFLEDLNHDKTEISTAFALKKCHTGKLHQSGVVGDGQMVIQFVVTIMGSGGWWLEPFWMTFPSYWEWNVIGPQLTNSVHDFSEGLTVNRQPDMVYESNTNW